MTILGLIDHLQVHHFGFGTLKRMKSGLVGLAIKCMSARAASSRWLVTGWRRVSDDLPRDVRHAQLVLDVPQRLNHASRAVSICGITPGKWHAETEPLSGLTRSNGCAR